MARPAGIVTLSVVFALVPLILQLPLAVAKQICLGFLKGYMFNIFMISGTFLMVAGTWVAIKFGASLPLLLLITTGAPALASLAALAYLILRDAPWLSLRPSSIEKRAFKQLFRTSLPMFLMQFGALLVNAVQPLIISHIADLKTVAEYSIALKLYFVLLEFTMTGTSPFVPSFREAHDAGDVDWMRRTFYRLLTLRLAIATTAGLTLAVGGGLITSLWLGHAAITFSSATWEALGILIVAVTWVTTFSDLLTIMDRVWILVTLTLLNGVVTIGATVILVPRYGVLGGVLAAGCATVLGMTWILPIAAKGVLRRQPAANA
jgi:O-antigen/teichoic acid export membrane protein